MAFQIDFTTAGLTSLLVVSGIVLFFYKTSTTSGAKLKELSKFEVLDNKLQDLIVKATEFIEEIHKNDLAVSTDSQKAIYRHSYNGEELLKFLIKFDGIELVNDDGLLSEEEYLQLKNKRKAIIKEIQLTIKDQDRKRQALAGSQ